MALVFDSIIHYINEKKILDGIYLELNQEEIINLVGINGAGKSTLLRIGIGDIKPSSGNVFIDGEIRKSNYLIANQSKISFLPQQSCLPEDLKIKHLINELEINIYNDEFINRMIKSKEMKIREFSYGEKRYLEVYCLLNLDRKYYLLDEPFTGIEPLIIERICDLIHSLKMQGKGILIVDHYIHYLKLLESKNLILYDGHIKLYK